MVNPCNVLDALADFQLDLMNRLNKKFEQLRRLARLLEQLGDLTWLIPDLSKLIPIVNIDFDVYNQLAAACPFLGLPPNPIQDDLNKLRGQVLAAYNGYARKLLNHPFIRLGKLQDEMDGYRDQIIGALGMGSDYIRCLQAMCAAGSALGSTISKLSQVDVSKTVTTFTNNFVHEAGSVLTEPLKIKYGQAQEALAQVKEMGATAGADYKALSEAKALQASTYTTQPVYVSVPITKWPSPPYAP
jgi:hypothetical protein